MLGPAFRIRHFAARMTDPSHPYTRNLHMDLSRISPWGENCQALFVCLVKTLTFIIFQICNTNNIFLNHTHFYLFYT